jgi:hypothetical protein
MKKLLILLVPLLLYCDKSSLFNNKTVGIEISPLRLILQESDMHTFSGGFSYFLAKQNAELHFPLYFEQQKFDTYNTQVITLDAEYRKFINDNGFYIGGLFRVTKLWGGKDDKSTTKFGIGTSAGYRFFYKNSFYYGIGVSYTRYIKGENHIFGYGGVDMTDLDNDTRGIFEFEFLKIGIFY